MLTTCCKCRRNFRAPSFARLLCPQCTEAVSTGHAKPIELRLVSRMHLYADARPPLESVAPSVPFIARRVAAGI